jgi:hypothetical protein
MNRRHLLSLLGGTALSPLLPKGTIAEESLALEPVVKLETERYFSTGIRILVSADGRSFINMTTGSFRIASDEPPLLEIGDLEPGTEYEIRAQVFDNSIDWESERD